MPLSKVREFTSENDTAVFVGLGTGIFLVLTGSKRSRTVLMWDFRRKSPVVG